MATNKYNRARLAQVVSRKFAKPREPVKAWTGKPNSDGVIVTASSELDYPALQVWVRVGSASAAPAMAWDVRGLVTHAVPNTPVMVEYDMNGELQISSVVNNREIAQKLGDTATSFLRNNLAVATSELRPLQVTVSGMELTIVGYLGNWFFVPELTIDLTSYIPGGSDEVQWVLVYVDPAGTDTVLPYPKLKAQAAETLTSLNAAHVQDVTQIYRPSHSIPVAGVLLENGDTLIDESRVVDVRQFVNAPRRRAVLRYVEDAGTNGGATANETWNDVLWTSDETSDPTNALILSEDSATFRLAAGDWDVWASVTAYRGADVALRIYDVTNSVVVEESSVLLAPTTGVNVSIVYSFEVSSDGLTEYKLQLYTQTQNSSGFGLANSRTSKEVYAKMVITNT